MFFIKKLIILLILAGIAIYISDTSEVVPIPSTSIRMRVIAKSDSEKDQKDKLIIKSALEEKLYEIISGENNYENIDEAIKSSEKEIEKTIQNTLDENDISSSFSTNYGYNFFPEKEFKGLKYPAGNYKSYVVTLGDGKGENWWCVLYPPLCLIEENTSDYEYHSLIKDTLNKYN